MVEVVPGCVSCGSVNYKRRGATTKPQYGNFMIRGKPYTEVHRYRVECLECKQVYFRKRLVPAST